MAHTAAKMVLGEIECQRTLAMRGRKTTPTRLALLHGNPGKRPLNRHEPRPIGDLTDPPGWLTDAQKAEWAHMLTNMPGTLKLIDGSLLAVLVVAIDLHRQAVEAVHGSGLMVATPNGHQIQSPYLPIINRQAAIIARTAAELGLSPTSRARICIKDGITYESHDKPKLTLQQYLDAAPPIPKMN